jgi:hypothetical protein
MAPSQTVGLMMVEQTMTHRYAVAIGLHTQPTVLAM